MNTTQPLLPPQRPSKLAWLTAWWERGVWHRVALFAALGMLGICTCCSGFTIFAFSPAGQALVREGEATSTAQTIATAQAQATAAEYALLHPKPTATDTAIPTATATDLPTYTPSPTDTATPQPTNTPAPRPTNTPAPPPTATPCPDPCNPWGYNFDSNGGSLIYNPPSDFCSWFNCIASFWDHTNGYVEECQDTTFSHSGGVSGSCSYHGGNWRPLYSH